MVESFKIDHTTLKAGLHKREALSRLRISNFELRFFAPSSKKYLRSSEIHTIEHCLAFFLRHKKVNTSLWDSIISVHPMGCKTGFNVLMYVDLDVSLFGNILKTAIDASILFLQENRIPPGMDKFSCGNPKLYSIRSTIKKLKKFRDII